MIESDRDEYLAQCKRRALKYLDTGDVINAIASMQSDLQKHKDFVNIAKSLDPMGLFIAMKRDIPEARRFIMGYR